MVRSLLICVSLAVVSGCCSAPILEPPIGLPICEQPIVVDQEIWDDITLLRETFTANQLSDENCIIKLKDRITRHDEVL